MRPEVTVSGGYAFKSFDRYRRELKQHRRRWVLHVIKHRIRQPLRQAPELPRPEPIVKIPDIFAESRKALERMQSRFMASLLMAEMKKAKEVDKNG